MAPDRGKVQAVKDWPVPSDASEVRQFLGLASYYRRYVLNFVNIAAPLHQLTEKGTMYSWTPECDASFNALKKQLTQAPILAYPKFGSGAGQFVLATDASNTGIGAVLEQEGRVVAYASRPCQSLRIITASSKRSVWQSFMQLSSSATIC